jgi:hypothetical protein
MRRLLSAASKLTAEAPSPKTAARKRPLTLYHGSVVAVSPRSKFLVTGASAGSVVPSDQFGTYFTKTRWHADFYAGKRGTVYVGPSEAQAHPSLERRLAHCHGQAARGTHS